MNKILTLTALTATLIIGAAGYTTYAATGTSSPISYAHTGTGSIHNTYKNGEINHNGTMNMTLRIEKLYANPTIKSALDAAGVVVPTPAEMLAFGSGHTAIHTYRQTMTDTDRTALQAIHAAAEKAERDFYRSKGVTLPTEATYTTMDANKQKIHTVIDALPASVRATLRPADDGKKWKHDGKRSKKTMRN